MPVPNSEKISFLGVSKEGEILYTPLLWEFIATHSIQENVTTLPPIENWPYDEILNDLKRLGYARDNFRTVSIFDTVALQFGDELENEKSFTIIRMPLYSNEEILVPQIKKGTTISANSAMGKALIGAKLGDWIEWETPQGTEDACIKQISKAPREFYSALYRKK